MYMRTRKKQNCVNGVDFLQYYLKKTIGHITGTTLITVVTKSNFLHNEMKFPVLGLGLWNYGVPLGQ